MSLDKAEAQKFVAHLALLGGGKYGVELIANLGRVPPVGRDDHRRRAEARGRVRRARPRVRGGLTRRTDT